ncbi:hypothetical protein Y032_0085g1808 [Ancylostoma ceylanicum]|uniref:Anaphase-promoting complex subunit 4-like WD40 domain-containing protein n=1 Tax=Ancylostoma ceylanicum TaxID=53326 RepID=A0A016TP63_9BILA|nr:hypothetical protein Y032_0085g1808 [Ancylostoma ceylanicum]
MSRPPPRPIFVHHGFMGGVTSCALVNAENGKGILVGTGAGRCELYDAETHTLIRTVYVDEEKRAISSVGSFNGQIWVHIRNSMIVLLGPADDVRISLKTAHCGYCKATIVGDFMVYPDAENEEQYLRVVDMHSGDRNRITLKHLPLSLTSIGGDIVVGDEAGTITRISVQGEVEAEVSLCKDPIFCLAATPSFLACGTSKPPLLLLPSADIRGDRRKIDYPQSSRGVGALAFSTSGKTLVAGFWDGSIRAYSVKNLTILVYLNLHTETITQLLWGEVAGEERLIAASQDEKLSLWKLK